MAKKNLPQFTEDQIKKLESIYPRLSSLTRSLELILAKPLVNELKDIEDIFKSIFENHWKSEEEYEKEVYQELDKISKKNKFKSVWSIEEIGPKDFDKPFSKNPVKHIGYDGNGINFAGKGKKMTWLDAWKHADKLIKESEDEHHIFIEDFKERPPGSGIFEITTGS